MINTKRKLASSLHLYHSIHSYLRSALPLYVTRIKREKAEEVVRSLYGAFSTLRPFGLLYSYPQQVPAFNSRGATHHTDARELYQRRR